jgi:multidrug efflux pump subunit AcrA (membrane-fusion protein)
MTVNRNLVRRLLLPRAAALVAGAIFCTASPAILKAQSAQSGAAADSDPRIVHADCIGTPSEQHRLCFEGNSEGSDVIKSVLVKPGDYVKAGDVLMVEDTDQAYAELAILKVEADAVGAINEAQVTIDAKRKLVDMLTNLSHGNYSGEELINAQMDLDVANAKKKQAEEEHDRNVLGYQRELVKIEHMKLRSPIDGVVESVNLFAGEAVDSSSDKDGACFVVANDPLWVEFHLDVRRAGRLAVHDPVEVAFPDRPADWRKGEVIYLDPMVEYVGQTRTVRVSIPNPEHRPSGLHMIVRLPEKAVADLPSVGAAQP